MPKEMFKKVDLNLLRVLVVLTQERHMGKTAERLMVTQPAVSKSLKKLREYFEDELFVKTQRGLSPTLKTIDIYDEIEPLITKIENSVYDNDSSKKPIFRDVIKIAVSPHFLSGIANELLEEIRKISPNTQVQLVNFNSSSIDRLVTNEIDYAISYELAKKTKEIYNHPIVKDDFKLIVRKQSLIYKNNISLNDLKSSRTYYEIATLIAAGWNDTISYAEVIKQSYLANINVVFRTELPSAVINIVKKTDIAFPASKFLLPENDPDLKFVDIDFVDKIGINTTIYGYFHVRNRHTKMINELNKICNRIFTK
ncbi:hypothetical protein C9980_05065 [Vibrio mediterranei]|uniref:LysR family transcriptional regulator n=2 Tax=Vibrio mediterranei TaxID=689 RepID=UPI000BBB0694|nr:hypothetical protein COR52_02595 [Vibrio mediterranei]PTC06118.1 hypothetical protein C9980_05065 [Vibrio mediterranei]